MNTLLFSQKIKTFFTDLSDTDQKEIFRKVLLLDDYVGWYNECNVMLKDLEKKQNELENEIAILFGNVESTLRHIESMKQKKEDFYKEKQEKISLFKIKVEESNNLLERNLQRLKEEQPLEDLLKLAEDAREKYGNLQGQLSNLDSSFSLSVKEIGNKKVIKEQEIKAIATSEISKVEEEKRKELNLIEINYSDRFHEVEDKETVLDKEYYKLDTEIQSLGRELQPKEKLLSKYKPSSKTICPLCGTELSGLKEEEVKKHLEEVSIEVSRIRTLIEEKIKRSNEISKERNTIRVFIEELREEFVKIKERQSKPYEQKIGEISSRLEEVLNQLRTAEKEMIEEEIKKLEAKKNFLKNELSSLFLMNLL
jgi:DNA repair exonuclease SbcCD ATPase subunit